MDSVCIIVLSTVPDRKTGISIATKLVQESAAACVNIIPAVTSIFLWQGAINQEEEQLLIIKTRKNAFATVKTIIEGLHPYEVPEIIAMDIPLGNEKYLQWIDSLVTRAS